MVEDRGEPGYVGDEPEEDSLTRCIWLWNLVIRVKDDLEDILYTSTNPSPSRIHWSRKAVYSSWPAVSNTSSIHDWPSITTCFRYESSIVGSYCNIVSFHIGASGTDREKICFQHNR
jgi:hypothetical protein